MNIRPFRSEIDGIRLWKRPIHVAQKCMQNKVVATMPNVMQISLLGLTRMKKRHVTWAYFPHVELITFLELLTS